MPISSGKGTAFLNGKPYSDLNEKAETELAKKALIIAELLEECNEISNGEVAEEILRWFREEALAAPWVKKFSCVEVRDV